MSSPSRRTTPPTHRVCPHPFFYQFLLCMFHALPLHLRLQHPQFLFISTTSIQSSNVASFFLSTYIAPICIPFSTISSSISCKSCNDTSPYSPHFVPLIPPCPPNLHPSPSLSSPSLPNSPSCLSPYSIVYQCHPSQPKPSSSHTLSSPPPHPTILPFPITYCRRLVSLTAIIFTSSAIFSFPYTSSNLFLIRPPSSPPPLQPRSKHTLHCPYPSPWCHLSSHIKPTTYTQASKHSQWRTAMNAEIQDLLHQQTWTLVPLPSLNKIG